MPAPHGYSILGFKRRVFSRERTRLTRYASPARTSPPRRNAFCSRKEIVGDAPTTAREARALLGHNHDHYSKHKLNDYAGQASPVMPTCILSSKTSSH